jgi:hypothetical protein
MGFFRNLFAKLFGRKSVKTTTPVAASKASKQPAKAAAKTAPKAPAKSAAKAPAKKAAAPAKKLQEQCAALTAAAKQCSRSSRDSSKYCGSHEGYQPPARGKARAAGKNTAPVVTGVKDTAPSARRPAAAKVGAKKPAAKKAAAKPAAKKAAAKPAAKKAAAKPAAKKAAAKPAAKKAATK